MRVWKIEKELHNAGINFVCGIDEAGRGPLAGPVVASAVILPPRIKLPGLNDSKKLSPAAREKLFAIIVAKAVYGIGIVSHKQIDKIGIVKAVGRAMRTAIKNLTNKIKTPPDCLLIDGIDNFQFTARGARNTQSIQSARNTFIPTAFIEKGDTRVRSIQAASIIAKVTRDKIMIDYDKIYPIYGFQRHKGYGTKSHYSALRRHGRCEIHRITFCPK